jgi:hypothetical protein
LGTKMARSDDEPDSEMPAAPIEPENGAGGAAK